MKKYSKAIKIHFKDIVFKIMLLVTLSVFLGCGGQYGRLAVNNTVKMQFENYEVLSDHHYYYSGSFARPRAVIGVQKEYTLQPGLWVPVDLTPELLKNWVNYYGANAKYFQGNNGSDILTEDGEKIGVWYAFIDWKDWATVKKVDEKVVAISTPIVQEKEIMIWRWGFATTPGE
jgi:hypothetical protein